MKISPLAQGTGVPANDNSTSRNDSSARARAIAVATGQALVEQAQPSGDAQVDRAQASIRRIKMNTQQSTNRHDMMPEMAQEVAEEPQITTSDVNEQAEVTEDHRPISPQFAALARQKRAIQVKEMELAKREEALRAQSPINSADYISKADLLANPLKMFEAGLTYDQLTEAILNSQNNQNIDVQALKTQIREDLKKELSEEFSSRDSQAEAQVLADLKAETMELTREGDQFEAIRAARAHDDVVSLIHRVWKQGWPELDLPKGHVLDTSKAAEFVETQLIEESLPFAKLKKVQSRLTPAQEEVLQQMPVAPKPNTRVMRTLTNRDSASPIMDRRARAIAAMQGTLKKG